MAKYFIYILLTIVFVESIILTQVKTEYRVYKAMINKTEFVEIPNLEKINKKEFE